MPDITMCADDDCPQSAKCYRFMAVPNKYRQSYAVFRLSPDSSSCDYYSPIRKGDIIRRQLSEPVPVPSPAGCPPVAEDG